MVEGMLEAGLGSRCRVELDGACAGGPRPPQRASRALGAGGRGLWGHYLKL